MSGVKCSTIRLEPERKACQEALSKISTFLSSNQALRERMDVLLKEIPEGVKQSFHGGINKAKNWQTIDTPTHSTGMNSNELNIIATKLQSINDAGKEVIQQLVEIKEVRREAKAKELIGNIETVKSDLAGIETLLNKWVPGKSESISNVLNGLYSEVEKGDFPTVEKETNSTKITITKLGQEVTSLQQQDDQRSYVLESLRSVCKEMGWKEEGEPKLQERNNPASPILHEVNTYSAGKIKFQLSLEGIRLESDIPQGKDTCSREKDPCYKEFDNLSDRLKKFGVVTKFERLEAPEEEPRLIQKGELDLPDEAIEMSREA